MNMDNFKIDILLATYNGEKYIRKQLDSILQQSYENWILRIHDDGSSDKTVAIIKEYEKYDGRILYYEDSNVGLGSKNNFDLLMGRSKADFVLFADQDDIWPKNKLNQFIHYAEKVNVKNKPMMIFSNYSLIDSNDRVIRKCVMDKWEKAIFDTNTTFSLMSHFLTDYYILLNHKHTELDKIIMRSIRQFSITLSTKNQYERIVKLCSILDAAILKDNEAGIKESLKKYIPILVSEDLTMRETVNQTLELMYSVRSDYIHHGKEAKVEFQEIIDMNIIVLSTIIRFLQLRHTYESPKMIIKAIDKLQLSVHL